VGLLLAAFAARAQNKAGWATPSAPGQGYEGFIADLPVWVELSIPTSDGKAAGSYFYRTRGKELQLEGERQGQKLILRETWRTQVTGSFTLDLQEARDGRERRMLGTWQKPGATTAPLPVKLFVAAPASKRYARLDPDQLKLADQKTFGDKLDECSGAAYGTKGRTAYQVPYCRKNLLSTFFSWEYLEGPHPSSGMEYHTFDLAAKKEIVLWDEIAPGRADAFTRVLAGKVDPILAKRRKERPDKDWLEVFSTFGDESVDAKSLPDMFKLTDGTKLASFYLADDGVHMLNEGYFGFPYAMLSMEVGVEAVMPFAELQRYLRKGSALRSLTAE
jgi:hypothetical protein